MNLNLEYIIMLLLRRQLARKFSVMKLTKNTLLFNLYNHNFTDRRVKLFGCDILRKKHTAIHSLLSDKMSNKGALIVIQHYHQVLDDHKTVLRKAVHSSPGNRFRTTSSSAITYTSTTEEAISRDTDMSKYEVLHDKDKKYFFIRLQESNSKQQEALAKVEYKWIGPGLVDLYHTEVPQEFQGKGIAKVLAKAAFDTFCEQDVMMRPTCTYLQKYLRENQTPLYMKHLEPGFVL